MKIITNVQFDSLNTANKFSFEVLSLGELKTMDVYCDCISITVKDSTLKKHLHEYLVMQIENAMKIHWKENSSNLTHRPGDGRWFDEEFKTETLHLIIQEIFTKERNIFLAVKGTWSFDYVLNMLAKVTNRIMGYKNYGGTDEAFDLSYKLIQGLNLRNPDNRSRDSSMSFGRFN